MDELAKAIQAKYIEDLTAKYPLYRFVMLFLFIIATYTYTTSGRFLSGIANLKLSFVFDFKTGLVEHVTVSELIICLLLTKLCGFSYQKINKYIFSTLAKIGSFDKYTNELKSNLYSLKTDNTVINYYLSQDLSKELEKKRIKLKCTNVNGEYSLTLALIMLYGIKGWGVFDIAIFIILVVFVIYLNYSSFRYYVEQFMPSYVAEKILLGSDIKFGDQ